MEVDPERKSGREAKIEDEDGDEDGDEAEAEAKAEAEAEAERKAEGDTRTLSTAFSSVRVALDQDDFVDLSLADVGEDFETTDWRRGESIGRSARFHGADIVDAHLTEDGDCCSGEEDAMRSDFAEGGKKCDCGQHDDDDDDDDDGDNDEDDDEDETDNGGGDCVGSEERRGRRRCDDGSGGGGGEKAREPSAGGLGAAYALSSDGDCISGGRAPRLGSSRSGDDDDYDDDDVSTRPMGAAPLEAMSVPRVILGPAVTRVGGAGAGAGAAAAPPRPGHAEPGAFRVRYGSSSRGRRVGRFGRGGRGGGGEEEEAEEEQRRRRHRRRQRQRQRQRRQRETARGVSSYQERGRGRRGREREGSTDDVDNRHGGPTSSVILLTAELCGEEGEAATTATMSISATATTTPATTPSIRCVSAQEATQRTLRLIANAHVGPAIEGVAIRDCCGEGSNDGGGGGRNQTNCPSFSNAFSRRARDHNFPRSRMTGHSELFHENGGGGGGGAGWCMNDSFTRGITNRSESKLAHFFGWRKVRFAAAFAALIVGAVAAGMGIALGEANNGQTRKESPLTSSNNFQEAVVGGGSAANSSGGEGVEARDIAHPSSSPQQHGTDREGSDPSESSYKLSSPSSDAVEWKQLGQELSGLINESGVTVAFDPTTGNATFGYGPRSNFTSHGSALSISDDGRTLCVGEAGTETVRVFEWDSGSENWKRKGQVLRNKRQCDEEGREVFYRGNGNYRADPTQFLSCFTSFGFSALLSGDGRTVIVTSIGHNNQTGMVRSYTYDGASSLWIKMGSDIVGDNPNDGFGSILRSTPDGRTLALVSAQSIDTLVAERYGLKAFWGRGYVRVYDWNESAKDWIKRGDDIVGRGASVGLSYADITDDGRTIAIGTLRGGYVEVFDWRRQRYQEGNVDQGGDEIWVNRPSDGNAGLLVAPIGEKDFGMPVMFCQGGKRMIVGSEFIGDVRTSTSDANLMYTYEWRDRDDASLSSSSLSPAFPGKRDGGGSWKRLDRLVVLKSASGGKRGRSAGVTVSADGSVLVAAFMNSVEVFEWDEEAMQYLHQKQRSSFLGGAAIALSRDGLTFAIGKPYDNTLGFGMGRTIVHTKKST